MVWLFPVFWNLNFQYRWERLFFFKEKCNLEIQQERTEFGLIILVFWNLNFSVFYRIITGSEVIASDQMFRGSLSHFACTSARLIVGHCDSYVFYKFCKHCQLGFSSDRKFICLKLDWKLYIHFEFRF